MRWLWGYHTQKGQRSRMRADPGNPHCCPSVVWLGVSHVAVASAMRAMWWGRSAAALAMQSLEVSTSPAIVNWGSILHAGLARGPALVEGMAEPLAKRAYTSGLQGRGPSRRGARTLSPYDMWMRPTKTGFNWNP